MGLERVPTMISYEVDYEEALSVVKGFSKAVRKGPFVHCNMDLPHMDKWLRTQDGTKLLGSLQLMVGGVTKSPRLVNRARSKIGYNKTDHMPSVFAQREIATRAAFDLLVGNDDRYNNDFVQVQPDTGDRLLVYIDQGRFVNSTLLPEGFFRVENYCRFYYQPIQQLQSLPSLREAVESQVHQDPLLEKWFQQGLIEVTNHPTLVFLDERVKHVLQFVDHCIETHGHDYVFLDP